MAYFSHTCPDCKKVFFTFNDHKEQASQVLFNGLKQHMQNYKEPYIHQSADHYAEYNANSMYSSISESTQKPIGGYKL